MTSCNIVYWKAITSRTSARQRLKFFLILCPCTVFSQHYYGWTSYLIVLSIIFIPLRPSQPSSLSDDGNPLHFPQSCCGLEWLVCNPSVVTTAMTCLNISGSTAVRVPLSSFTCGQSICPCKATELRALQAADPSQSYCVSVVNYTVVDGVCRNVTQCPPGTRLYRTSLTSPPIVCTAFGQFGNEAIYSLLETACEGDINFFLFLFVFMIFCDLIVKIALLLVARTVLRA